MGEPNAVRFADLVGFLHRFGYAVAADESAEDHTTFRHPGRALRIILPPYRDGTPVRPAHLVVVRHVLADSDPREADEFDAWIESQSSPAPRRVPAR